MHKIKKNTSEKLMSTTPTSSKSGQASISIGPRLRQRRLSQETLLIRQRNAARNRELLMLSAARIVGQHGYKEASVQRITTDAGLALGTFYRYYESRQALFDQLLPHFGLQMIEHVRQRVQGFTGFFDVEERGVKAVFEYLIEHPWFWRLLNEAEIEAPNAWAQHHQEVITRYVRFLKRVQSAGELKRYSTKELGTLAQMLVAARDYIYRCHLPMNVASKKIPVSVMRTYRKFIESGLR
jgi:AcrR family transcriptional regulator